MNLFAAIKNALAKGGKTFGRGVKELLDVAPKRAYAPADNYMGSPLTERPKEKNALIEAAARNHGLTLQAQQELRNLPVYFGQDGGNSNAYYLPDRRAIVMQPRSKQGNPSGTLTHEYLHDVYNTGRAGGGMRQVAPNQMEQTGFTGLPKNLAPWWNQRKMDWDYNDDEARMANELHSTLPTEVPTRAIPENLLRYYAQFLEAGKWRETQQLMGNSALQNSINYGLGGKPFLKQRGFIQGKR